MRCPACNTRFPQFASWKLAFKRPLVCAGCGTTCRRIGKWTPALIAVLLLIAFNQLIGTFHFSTLGTVLLLVGLVLTAMWVDEMTVTLAPADSTGRTRT